MFFLAKGSKIWMLHFAKFCSYSWNKGDILWSKARALSHFDILKFLKLRCTVSLWPIQPLFLMEFICMVHTKMFINLIHLYLWRSQLYKSQQIISVQHTVRSGGWKGCGITLLTFVFFFNMLTTGAALLPVDQPSVPEYQCTVRDTRQVWGRIRDRVAGFYQCEQLVTQSENIHSLPCVFKNEINYKYMVPEWATLIKQMKRWNKLPETPK